jgi:hypothetical protein
MSSKIRTYLAGSTILLVTSLWISVPVCAAEAPTGDSSEVAGLFSVARTHAHELRLDAEVMESYTWNPVSWATQVNQIYNIRQHTSDLAKVIQKLNELRATASPRQQAAIDRLNPTLSDLAASVNSMIDCVSDHTASPLGAGTYRECVRNHYKLAVEMAEMINDFVSRRTAKA